MRGLSEAFPTLPDDAHGRSGWRQGFSIPKEARRLGYLVTENPAKDCRVNPRARRPEKTYAYTLQEIFEILAVLPEPAATVFAVASFAGLRRVSWKDLSGRIFTMATSG
jgi:hypothetical protein